MKRKKGGPEKNLRSPDADLIAANLKQEEALLREMRRQEALKEHEEIVEVKRKANIEAERVLSEYAVKCAQSLVNVATKAKADAARANAAKAVLDRLSEVEKDAASVVINVTHQQAVKVNDFARISEKF